MSSYSDFIRWIAGCRDRPGYGITAGDTMHRGLGEYNASRPCPNGLPIDKRLPGDCSAWRERVARARRDIEAGRLGTIRDDIAAELTVDEIQTAQRRIDEWDKLRQRATAKNNLTLS